MTRPITADDVYNINLVETPTVSPNGTQIAFVRGVAERDLDAYSRTIWLASKDGANWQARAFSAGAPHQDMLPKFSPDGAWLAFLSTRFAEPWKAPQLCVMPVNGGEARQLTRRVTGVADYIWLPDSSGFVFVSAANADEREAEDDGNLWPTEKEELKAAYGKWKAENKKKTDPRVVDIFPYRSGTSFVDDRHLHAYEISFDAAMQSSGMPRRITNGAQHYTSLSLANDGASLFAMTKRDSVKDSLFLGGSPIRIDLQSGNFKVLGDDDWHYAASKVSPSGKYLATIAIPADLPIGRTQHVILIDIESNTQTVITKDLDRTCAELHWSADDQLFLRVDDKGASRVLSVDPATAVLTEEYYDPAQLIVGFAQHATVGLVVANRTNTAPTELSIIQDGTLVSVTALHDTLLSDVTVGCTEEVWYTSPDGNQVQGWIVYPPEFDASKKYPLALNIHGGPHVMWSSAAHAMWHEWQMHANAGYVVFYCNPRGSDGYGEAHMQAIHQNWGAPALTDILAGVDLVVERGFIDTDKMAVTGGSYGGYMTVWTIGHDNRFAAAVTQRGVYQLGAFMGTSDIPELIEYAFEAEMFADDEQKLWKHTPIAYSNNIDTPTLIIHAENDFRVPISEAEALYIKLRRKGVPVEMVRYPDEGHELSRSGKPKHRIDRLERMLGWFDKYCK